MKSISSSANASFRAWHRLATHPRETRMQGRALAEGAHLAQAALDPRTNVEAVLLRRGSRGEEVERLAATLLGNGVDAYELSVALFEQIAPVAHGAGLMLVVVLPRWPLPRAALHDLLFLDGVQDPGNVGTLLRTAAAAGIAEVLSSPATAALWAPKTLRAGQGAHFRLRLHEQVAPGDLPPMLDGPWIGADARGGTPLWSATLPPGPVGWIFGAEGGGLSPGARGIARHLVSVPISADVESLNVAAAAAVCLFERRRRLSPSL